MTTTWLRVAGSVVVIGALAACGTGSVGPDDGASTAASGVAPTADGEWISRTTIDGAQETTIDGVTFDVPEGMSVDEPSGRPGLTTFRVRDAGAELAAVSMTITSGFDTPLDDAGVDAMSVVVETELLHSQEWDEVERRRGSWDGMAYAVAVTATSTSAAAFPTSDLILVTARNEDGSRAVAVSAKAPVGELDGSTAFDVLRSVRFDG
jgi:hypothetical protein